MFRKFFVAFLSFLFVVLSSYFAIFSGIVATVTDKDFYAEDFSNLTYSFLQEELLAKLKPVFPDNFSEDELKSVLAEVFDREGFGLFVLDQYDNFSHLSADEEGWVELAVSTDWISSKRNDLAKALATKLIVSLPVCEAEILQIDFDNLTCLPADFAESDLSSRLATTLDTAVFSQIPAGFTSQIKVPEDAKADVSGFFTSVLFLTFWVFVCFLFLLLLLLLIITPHPWSNVLKVQVKAVFFSSLVVTLVFLFSGYLDFAQTGFVLDIYHLFVSNAALRVYPFSVSLLALSFILFLILKFKNLFNDSP